MRTRTVLAGVLVLLSGLAMSGAPALADEHEDGKLIESEKAAWEAWKNGDGDFFEATVADDGMMILADGGMRSKAEAIAEITGGGCEVAGYSLSDFQVHSLGAEAKILTYEAEQDAVCGGMKIPESLRVSSTYALRDGKWMSVHYQETVRMEME